MGVHQGRVKGAGLSVTNEDEVATLELSGEVFKVLEEIAVARNVDVAEALKQALATELFIIRQAPNGSKIVIQRPDSSVHEFAVNGG
jgi:pyruvate formate-lyase activating enzyme-like uncharacterized protein